MAHRFLSLILAASVVGTSALAQSDGVPAEFPPADFAGNQYVDSEGCAFIRAGISGITNWVPRVDRSRRQICNFTPTFAAAEPAPAAAEQEATPAMAAAPGLVQTPTAADRSRALPTLVPAAPAPETDEPATMTLAQACEGKFGVQPGFVSSTTGEPIDCGPELMVTASASSMGSMQDGIPRMTRSDICREMASGDIQYVDALTGQPIDCGGSDDAPVAIEFDRGIMGASCNIVRSQTGQSVKCDPVAQASQSFMSSMSVRVPASNPSESDAQARSVPAGYEAVWTDGRINPDRGVTFERSFATAPRDSVTGQRVQVASFGVHSNAEALVSRLIGLGYPAASQPRGSLMLVSAGPFATASEQQSALRAIRQLGFADAFVTN